jgi:hypothetical protein
MPNSYTQDDLILFIYGELTEKEKFSIQKALETSPELHKTYHSLLQVIGSLDTLNYEPHPSSVEIILEHSHHQEHFH